MQVRPAILALFLTSSALAADSIEAEREFNVMDNDGDGVIQRAEAEHSTRYPLLPYVFDAVDLDGSGAVEYDEWGQARFYLRGLDAGGPGAAGR